MRLGLDLLGLGSPYWPVRLTAKRWPKGWALGCFDQGWSRAPAFGDPLPQIKRLIRLGAQFSDLRVHLDYDYGKQLPPLKGLNKRAKRWQEFAAEHPNIRVWISFSCEYRSMNRAAVRAQYLATRAICPSCIVVCCPETGHGYVTMPQSVVEIHGDNVGKTGQLVSLDGTNAFGIDGPSWLKKNKAAGVEIAFLWIPPFNLREFNEPPPPWKPPACPKRTRKPTAEEFQAVVDLAEGL